MAFQVHISSIIWSNYFQARYDTRSKEDESTNRHATRKIKEGITSILWYEKPFKQIILNDSQGMWTTKAVDICKDGMDVEW